MTNSHEGALRWQQWRFPFISAVLSANNCFVVFKLARTNGTLIAVAFGKFNGLLCWLWGKLCCKTKEVDAGCWSLICCCGKEFISSIKVELKMTVGCSTSFGKMNEFSGTGPSTNPIPVNDLQMVSPLTRWFCRWFYQDYLEGSTS